MRRSTRSARTLAVLAATGALLAPMVAPAPAATNEIPHPDEYFGRRIGAPGVLIRHAEILDYYRLLAERSDRVRLPELGETTLGRPFYYALVSSPENLARIDALLADNAKLYDPRGVPEDELDRILREGKSFVIVNGQIHSTEVGVSQGEILLAWRLAAGEDAEVRHILDNVVIAHVPVHNPDGQEMVIDWLDRQRGTPYQNSPPPFLYHHYTGHDNNRDWYMFTQVETRLSIEMQNRFHPQFTLDQHQQGSTGSRIFVPPFEDPWEPNVDPALIASNNMIGTFMGQVLTTNGYRGVEWKQRYDAWTPARAYYHTHGGVRILTEVASSDYADDLEIPFDRLGEDHRQRHWYFPMPWPGGTWTFSEVVDYHYAAAMAALRAAADLRPHLLRGMLAAQRRSVAPVAGPTAFVFPPEQPDPPVAAHLLQVLRIADVDVFRAPEGFRAGDVEVAAGSWVVPLAQPAGRFAKSVLEPQDYPKLYLYEGGPLDPPYDVTAHTLPMLMNVRVAETRGELPASLVKVEAPEAPEGEVVEAGSGSTVAYLLDPGVNNVYAAAVALAAQGLTRTLAPFEAGGRTWPAGTFVFEPDRGAAGIADRQALAETVRAQRIRAIGVSALPQVQTGWVAPPRVAVYQSYVPSMAEGWLRYVLDRHGIPYSVLHDADVRTGDLAPYSVIFVPPGSARAIVEGLPAVPVVRPEGTRPASPPEFAGGIGDEGIEALRGFVQGGGTLFTWEGSTELVTRYLGGPDDLGGELARTEINIPGSLLNARFDTGHWLAYGMDPEAPVFFWRSPFWPARSEGATTVTRYPDAGLLASGWIQGEELLAGRSAMLEVPLGAGRAVMAGFSPEYRGQAHGTYKILFNAIFRPRPERH